MATHAYIIERENAVIAIQKSVDELAAALAAEVKAEQGYHDHHGRVHNGGCYHDNLDVWGTTGVSLETLAKRCQELAKAIDKARIDAHNIHNLTVKVVNWDKADCTNDFEAEFS